MGDLGPLSTPRTAAGVLFFDETGRVLFVHPTYKPGLEIPGGYIMPGETPSQAAVREVREELGIDVRPGRLLVADWAPQEREGDKILFVFDGGVLSASTMEQVKVDGREIGGFAFHGRDQFDEILIPRLARRIRAALDARDGGRTDYLEHGEHQDGLLAD